MALVGNSVASLLPRCRASRQLYFVCRSRACIPSTSLHSTYSTKAKNKNAPNQHKTAAADREERKPPPGTKNETPKPPKASENAEKTTPKGRPPFRRKLKVAVIGGGITGVSAAHYLNKFIRNIDIALFEASHNIGGWINTKKCIIRPKEPVTNIGEIFTLMEKGPRSFRINHSNPASTLCLLELLSENDKELWRKVNWVKSNSEVGRNRYIYYPDRLTKVDPGRLLTARDPLLDGIHNVILEPFRGRRSDYETVEDESIHSVLSRRLDTKIADNIVSAIYHGIYAGDIKKLSFQALMPSLWYTERQRFGSLLRGVFSKKIPLQDRIIIEQLLEKGFNIKGFKPFSMINLPGNQSLPVKVVQKLASLPNFHYGMPCEVTNATYDKSKDVVNLKIKQGDNIMEEDFDYVICCTPTKAAASIVTDDVTFFLKEINYTTVMVINLLFHDLSADAPNLLRDYPGFGYLIPQSVSPERNPYHTLGIVFDSHIQHPENHLPGITKISVMMGGHYWDNMKPEEIPDPEEAKRRAMWYVKNHLNINKEYTVANAELAENCIPQYEVGHAGKMRKIHKDLVGRMGGKFIVAGAAYGGVAVPDCIKHAREVAKGISEGKLLTGLERWAYETVWVDPSTG